MALPVSSRETPMQLQKAGGYLIILIAASLRLYLFLGIHYTTDDALITFRYAENIADGSGFVYNIGEKVLGTTTFLNTLLIALFVKLGFSSFTAAFFLSLCADCFSGWILLRLFSEFPNRISWLPSFVFLFNP